jgi:RimJ/RimL family protein N-acetyltransferase
VPQPSLPIATDRLDLRLFTSNDLDALYAYDRLPEVARFLLREPRTREQSAEALERRMATTGYEKEGDALVLAVVLRETGELLGDVLLEWTSERNMTGEFGYVFNPAFHGKGYASEAAVEMLRLGFEELKLHRIIGRCEARNTASARLMERLGLRREAHFVRNEWIKGEWNDELVFAMLAEEWTARP